MSDSDDALGELLQTLRRTGHADDVGAAGVGEEGAEQVACAGPLIFHQGDGSGQGQAVA